MSATKEGLDELTLPDMARRLANMVRYGTVLEVNHETKSVRIKSGDIETDWMRWPAGSANSRKRRWDPPTVGEQVCMLSPTGDMRQATFIPGIYRDEYDAPSADPDEDLAEYSDGAVISYNVGTHTLTANLQEDTSLIMDRTSIKATRGNASVELTNTALTLTFGDQSLVMDAAGITLTGTTVNLN